MSSPATNPPQAPDPAPRATLSPDYQRDWPEYFRCVKGQPARETCVRALHAFAREGLGVLGDAGRATRLLTAVDIAAGEGRDTREILSQLPASRVVFTDNQAGAVEFVHETLTPDQRTRAVGVRCTMESLPVRYAAGLRFDHSEELSDTADFVNASFALPFCREQDFPVLWRWIHRILRPGGRFAGQLFGDRDDWASVNPNRHHRRASVEELLSQFQIEWLDEVEKDGSDAMGGLKHHHVFHIVARKR